MQGDPYMLAGAYADGAHGLCSASMRHWSKFVTELQCQRRHFCHKRSCGLASQGSDVQLLLVCQPATCTVHQTTLQHSTAAYARLCTLKCGTQHACKRIRPGMLHPTLATRPYGAPCSCLISTLPAAAAAAAAAAARHR
jgi:hypothetical protein